MNWKQMSDWLSNIIENYWKFRTNEILESLCVCVSFIKLMSVPLLCEPITKF